MTMADVKCEQCGHVTSLHTTARMGPATCTAKGCDCFSGPARRDDLVDIIDVQAERILELEKAAEEADARERFNKILDEVESQREQCTQQIKDETGPLYACNGSPLHNGPHTAFVDTMKESVINLPGLITFNDLSFISIDAPVDGVSTLRWMKR